MLNDVKTMPRDLKPFGAFSTAVGCEGFTITPSTSVPVEFAIM